MIFSTFRRRIKTYMDN